MVHVDEVSSGISFGCVCPACDASLIARKGLKNIHHFAHHNAPDCGAAIETSIHLIAKKILSDSSEIVLPSVNLNIVNAPFIIDHEECDWSMSPETKITFDDVKVEKRLGEIVPDIIISTKGRELIIEVAVTHFVDDAKLRKIQKMGVSAIEISFEDFENTFDDKAAIERIVKSSDKKKWLFNRKAVEIEREIKKRCSDLATKRKIKPGYGHEQAHGGRVYGCPQRTRLTRNGVPFAVPTEDCIFCKFCFSCGVTRSDNYIWCTAESRVTSYKTYMAWIQNHELI